MRVFLLIGCFSLFGCFSEDVIDVVGVEEISADQSGVTQEIAAATVAATDWPWWRGPNFNGVAAEGQTVPVTWSESKNVVWRADVPGRGHSSPTIVGNRIFLSTADKSQETQSVLAFNRETGEQIWKTDINQGGLPRSIHPKNTHATPTVASDGERLFVSFFNNASIQVTALDLDGKQIWQQVVGPFKPQQYEYGYAPSPAIHKSLVIVAADCDGGGYLAALNRKSGTIVWRKTRLPNSNYSSPIVTNIAGKDQLLISGCEVVAAFNPDTGDELWSCSATAATTCGTMVWDGDLVFASGGHPKVETVCVRADGSGAVVWKNRKQCYEQSMLAHDGYVYAVTDGGIAYCWKGEDGSEMWKSRLRGPVSSSPILAGGNIYLSNEQGTTYVFKADPKKFELVAENQLGNEAFASPTICGGQIFLRVADNTSGERRETLYCIGAPRIE